MLNRYYLLLIILSIFISSCVKKQIKPTTSTTDDQSLSYISTETVKTEDIKTEDIVDETKSEIEADVRQIREELLQTIYFDFDKYELTDKAKDILSENAKKIIENEYYVTIEGHCDERGTDQYNLSLGQKRANAVKNYYIRLGIPENRIATISYGEEKPICFEKNEECWSKNRRAETKVGK